MILHFVQCLALHRTDNNNNSDDDDDGDGDGDGDDGCVGDKLDVEISNCLSEPSNRYVGRSRGRKN